MSTNPRRQVRTSLSGPNPGSFPSRGTSPGRSSGRSRSKSPGRGSTSSRGTSPGSQRRRGSSDSSHSSRRDSSQRKQNGAQSRTAENGGVQSRRERPPQRRRSLPKKEKEVVQKPPVAPIPVNPDLGIVEMSAPPQRNWKDIVHESSASDADVSSLDSVNLGQVNPSFDPGGEQPISRINYKSMGVHFNDDKNTEHPIYYQSGPAEEKGKPKSALRKEKVVVKKPDGSKIIVVPNRHRRQEVVRPLKERDLTLLTVFSIVSIFLFFPTGIPACVYANKTRDEFQAGVQQGDLTKASKCAKKAERLIICSLVAGLLTGVLIFAVVEATRSS
ncbi:unnamed protein product [Owenia fusiformis]|uniref:Uncharacterized protein n=1 Tax=Owenia fusiformis TaxID=6347 RepID=A0A8S4NR23_OWEFU|nr:unnamed protein product [Owenia fusiformis]